jgi:hypothetical protein
LPYLVGVGCWCHKFLLSIPEYLLTKLSSTCPNGAFPKYKNIKTYDI